MRQPLLRRSGRRLAGDGAVLRPGAEAGRPAVGVDEGHLPAPHDQQPGGGARRRTAPSRTGPGRAVGARRRSRCRRRPARRQYVLCGALQLLIFLGYSYLAAFVAAGAIEWISAGSGRARHLPAVGRVRRRRLRRPVPPADPGQVDAHRSVEAPADPHLEPGVRPLLDRQDAGPVEPAGRCSSVRRCTCSTCGRWARRSGGASLILSRNVPVCTDLLTIGDGTVIRKDVVLQRLPGPRRPDPDRPGHPRQGRVRRRDDGARHRHLDGRRGPARPRLLPARRAGRARRRALARVPGAADHGGLPAGRAGAPAAPCEGPSTPPCSC